MPEQIRLTLPVEVKALDDERALIVRITSSKPDRSGDIVVPKGGKLDNYLKNPVVLFGHDYWSPPIARAESLEVQEDGILAKVKFPTPGSYEFADTIYELCKQGIMNAWSIGFRALRDKIELLQEGGRKFHEWELFEFSAVPVPAHPDALTLLRSAGVSEQVISKALDEEVLVPDEKSAEESKLEVKTLSVDLTEAKDGISMELEVNGTKQTITHLFTDEQRQVLTERPEAKSQLADQLKEMRDLLQPKKTDLATALTAMKSLVESTSHREGVTQ